MVVNMKYALLLSLALVGCGGSESGLSTAGKCSYEAGPAVVRPWVGTGQKVLFIGDSIIDYWDLPAYFPNVQTMNQGGAGQCSTEVHARFTRDALAAKPDVIVMGTAINDIATGQLSAAFEQQDALDAKAAGITVVIVGPYRPGTAERLTAHGKQVDNFNADMLAFSALHGFKYIDNTAPDKGELKADGVHPSDAGYVKLAGRIGL